MPATKKASSKRKAETSNIPLVKDLFSASKKKKKDEVLDEINNTNESKETKPVEKSEDSSDDSTVEQKPSPKAKKTAAIFKKSKSKKTKSKDDEEDDDEEATESKTNVNSSSSLKYDQEEFKKSSNGKDWNFKIASWNMNGIRACVEHGGIEYLKAEQPDIFCCQETKCDKSKIPPKAELKGYHCYWLSGDTQGYSGVGLMSKIKPLKVTYGINDKKHDDEGRVIVAEYEKFYVINSYIPNSGRGLVRLSYRMEWEKVMRKYLDSLNKLKPIVWCGDLNVAHNEIDLKNPETNKKTAGFTKEERECFTNLLTDGYFDSFRYLYPNLKDQYTYWSYFRNAREKNVGWRLDYFVLADKLKENLVDNVIRSKVTGSDHCPIVLYLNI